MGYPTLPKEIEDKLIRARLYLFTHSPFWAQLAMYLRPRLTTHIPTIAVQADGTLWMNEEFIRKASVVDMVWLLAHEVGHLFTMTHARKPDTASHMWFNIAADVVINYLITDCSGIKLPSSDLVKPWHKQYKPELEKYEDWITERVYYDLMKDAENQDACDGNHSKDGSGPPCDGSCESPGEGDESGGNQSGSGSEAPNWHDDSATRCGAGKDKMTEEQASEWKQRAASAAATAKAAGKLPAAIDQFICDLLQPKQDWRKELKFQMTAFMKGRWTWRKIGRRTAATVRTPGRDPEPPVACCYFDTSGSMSDDELIRCFSEGAAIARICGGNLWLILGDAVIYYNGDADPEAFRNLPVQRGGTDFRPIFEAIAESDRPPPQLFVGFSDLGGPFPESPPDFPVIWCVPEVEGNTNAEAPWGRVISVQM